MNYQNLPKSPIRDINTYLCDKQYCQNSALEYLLHEQYKPLDRLGKGAHAMVYLMKDTQTGEPVAVKAQEVIGAIDRLEVQLLNDLQGIPGIPEVLDSFVESNEQFIVTPVYACDLYRGGYCYPKDIVLRVGIDLVAILKEVHSRGVVHRDVKPANLMVGSIGEENRLILCDFGISRRYKNVDGTRNRIWNKDRKFKEAEYFSPGMDDQGPVMPLDDIVMLGFSLMALCNFRPFHGVNPENISEQKTTFLANPEKKLFGRLKFLVPIIKKIGEIEIWDQIDYDGLVQTLKLGMDEPAKAGGSYPLKRIANGQYVVE